MAFQQINAIKVKYSRGQSLVPMGTLVLKNRKFLFEYTPEFLEEGLQLSPFMLPLKPGVIECRDRVFDGLFGVFNDSLPDGWGRLLLDRKLLKLGVNPENLTSLDRLQYVGSRGMGALFYEPEIKDIPLLSKIQADLDLIAKECLDFQVHDEEKYIDDLLTMNGSSAGARPKILVRLIDAKNSLEMSNNTFFEKHNDWIIKFRSSNDPIDVGAIEYAYHLMAIEAGMDVPEARLFKSKEGSGYFGVKRFDRTTSQFVHMHSVSGLLHIDHRIPSFDYETLMKLILHLTKDKFECEKQFRHTTFNILSHNRDDHAKNFSFLMDENGVWCLSPAYDLIFSAGPEGEHCTMIMGEGKIPGISHLLKLADVASIKHERALEIIDQVKNAVTKWKIFAEEAGVTRQSSNRIQIAMDSVFKWFYL